METIPALEVIGGYKVHPAASLFPLLVGEEFDAMVASMGIFGLAIPIVVKGEYLIDGRNRLRAVIEANKQSNPQGRIVELKTIELKDDVESATEYIVNINATRRNLTPNQLLVIGAEASPMIAKEKKAKQVLSQFKAGVSGNPTGKAKKQVAVKPSPPAPRDSKKKDEQSTVGQLAKLTGESHHKARQVMAMVKAVEAGELPEDTIAKVKAGELKIKDAVPKRVPKPKTKKAADEPVPDKEKDDAFEDIKKAIDRYLDIDFSSKKLLREKIDTYLISKGN